ncbi:ROK family transcriptional regulator [Thalassiella azotivora]
MHQRPSHRPLRPTGKLLPGDARQHHRAIVLQALFGDGPASRADLARSTGLTRVTVSDVVGELLAEGLVEELGARPGTRVGKPATLVGFAADAARVVTLDLSGEDRMRGAVMDLDGGVRVRRSAEVGRRSGDAAVSLAGRLARDLIALSDRPVLGVGVGTPGVVDATGTVREAPNLGWHDTPLATLLGERLGVPAHVANDANTAALGEHTYGHADGSSLMVLRVGRGVGAGLILDGALLGGSRSAAGEIGHVVVDEQGERCGCGRVGCLETVLAVPHLREQLDRVPDDGAAAVLAAAGRRLGTTLAPVVSTLDLREVVLNGPADLLEGPLLDAAADTIRRCTLAVDDDERPVVRTSALGDDLVLVGAAVLVLAGELGVS